MNDVTQKCVNILHLTWESPTLLWMFKLLMRAGETRNSLNGCFICIQLFEAFDTTILQLEKPNISQQRHVVGVGDCRLTGGGLWRCQGEISELGVYS